MSASARIVASEDSIVVSLDGTLVLTDTFASSALEAVRRRPVSIFHLLAARLHGPAHCRRVAAEAASLKVDILPYNRRLIEYLEREKARGRRVILATRSDLKIAEGVAAHLGVFDDVIGGDGQTEWTGEEMYQAVQTKVGNGRFVYAGDKRREPALWAAASGAVLAGKSRPSPLSDTGANVEIESDSEGGRRSIKALLRCLRPHQWSKNALVFVPLVLAHRLTDIAGLGHAALAFLAICFAASCLYIVNDLLDLQGDRLHPRKRKRPLASGEVSIAAGGSLVMLMAAGALVLAVFLPPKAAALLLLYAVFSFTYSLQLKRILFLDVVSLSLLYAMRVLYGGAAASITISVWTLLFSLFLFVSLATVKRLGELRRVDVSRAGLHEYRGYQPVDVTQLSSLASASSYVAILVLALYINSPEVAILYRHPMRLWLLFPLFIYWLSRLTLLANRGDLHDDPVAFALTDRITWAVGLFATVILILSA